MLHKFVWKLGFIQFKHCWVPHYTRGISFPQQLYWQLGLAHSEIFFWGWFVFFCFNFISDLNLQKVQILTGLNWFCFMSLSPVALCLYFQGSRRRFTWPFHALFDGVLKYCCSKPPGGKYFFSFTAASLQHSYQADVQRSRITQL